MLLIMFSLSVRQPDLNLDSLVIRTELASIGHQMEQNLLVEFIVRAEIGSELVC
jgi:hypothetical protein